MQTRFSTAGEAETAFYQAFEKRDVRAMMDVSAETGKFVGVGFKKMFFPANEKAKALIDDPGRTGGFIGLQLHGARAADPATGVAPGHHPAGAAGADGHRHRGAAADRRRGPPGSRR